MMPNPHLPAEILDHVVDLLHDKPRTLKDCCLVSKSWVPRTRKHIFVNIDFYTAKILQSWKEMFPDPSNSPAYHTHTLSILCSRAVTPADGEAGDWIRGFSRVVDLVLDGREAYLDESGISLVPFHGFSPTIGSLYGFSPVLNSLYMNFAVLPSSQVFNLILSFPLLEDLTVITYRDADASTGNGNDSDGPSPIIQPSTLPMLTGSLELWMREGVKPIANRLLSLPGLHFQKLTLTWFYEEDLLLTIALVAECSYTLESLHITCHLGTSIRDLHPH
jgi:hypothetical protein